MSFSKLTSEVHSSSQRSSRNGVKPVALIWHHAVSRDWRTVVDMMVSGSKEVSANYVIGNGGEIIGVVDEQDRAWTSSSSYWDGRAITFEVCNETLAPSYTISAKATEALARISADISQRYGFDLVRDGAGSSVIGHRELYEWFGASYATACPGGLQIDATTALANSIIDGVVPEEDEMAKAKLWRDSDPKSKTYGFINAIEPVSGFDYHLQNVGEKQLLLRFGVVDDVTVTDLPTNEFNLLRNMASAARKP